MTEDERFMGEALRQARRALALGEVPPAVEGRLWVAPESFRSRVLEMLEREKAKGSEGFVAIKVNSLNDMDVMSALIDCSRAGVKIELFIRGICCLRPGLEGYTDNITVRSVIGRYLEHSRIFVFGRGEEQRIFMGSGDLLNRNTRRRVECFVEAVTPDTREQLLEIMEAFRQDREEGWLMESSGGYVREKDGEGTSSQDRLYRYFTSLAVEAEPLPTEEKKPSLFRRILNFFRKK